jgi:Cu(I)/Ag(I) efflux system membrane fusion protein
MPYEIVDLSSVWVLADVYESELRLVKRNMAATLRLNAFPDREFKGKVVFIDPFLDPKTRTVKVRLTFPNPTGELRPEMFGEVVLKSPPHDGLRIPPDAIIDSGTDKLVFVAIGEGKFSPRKVKLGESDGSFTEILSGLTRGERVVTRANFLIDSESRLRASLAEMAAATTSPAAPQSARVLSDPAAASPAPSAAPPVAPAPPHRGHGP